jgi:hypothetical protein
MGERVWLGGRGGSDDSYVRRGECFGKKREGMGGVRGEG